MVTEMEIIMKYMKYIVCLVLTLGIITFAMYANMETKSARKSLSQSAIRFHVLANSDSTSDQELKMKVKKAVVDYIYHNTNDFDTIDETKIFLTRYDARIKRIAENVLTANSSDYNISSTFGKDTFPTKSYGDVTFPAGEYTSYTLTIGSGKGHNWWCVLYPPLCFIDESTGVLPDSSKQQLKENLTETEYQVIKKYKFKYLTFLNKFIEN